MECKAMQGEERGQLKYASHSSVQILGTDHQDKEHSEEEDFEDGLFFTAVDPLAASSDAIHDASDEDNIFDCGICQDKLIAPKSLPCLHNFCLKCLDNYAKTLSFQDLSTGENIFQCPLCRIKTKVPESGVEQFPTNFHVTRLQDQKKNLDLSFTLREAVEYLEEREDEIVEVLQERKRVTQVEISNQRDAMVNKIDIYMDALHGKLREQFYIDSHKAIEALHKVKARLDVLQSDVNEGGESQSTADLRDTGSIVRLKEHAETVAKVANELEHLRVTANREQDKVLNKRLVFIASDGFEEHEIREKFGYVTERTEAQIKAAAMETETASPMTSWGQILISLLPAVIFVFIMKVYDATLYEGDY